jgi:hypothetical protein
VEDAEMRESEFKTFTVEFGAPKGIEWPWEVTLMFDKYGKILAIKQGCDILAPINIKPGPAIDDGDDGHPDCPPGSCARKIGAYIVCSPSYCHP